MPRLATVTLVVADYGNRWDLLEPPAR